MTRCRIAHLRHPAGQRARSACRSWPRSGSPTSPRSSRRCRPRGRRLARSKQAVLSAAIVIVGACSAVGFLVADSLGDVNGARLAAFTISGLITMLTTSMIPFAYEKGGLSAVWAVVGFSVTLASS